MSIFGQTLIRLVGIAHGRMIRSDRRAVVISRDGRDLLIQGATDHPNNAIVLASGDTLKSASRFIGASAASPQPANGPGKCLWQFIETLPQGLAWSDMIQSQGVARLSSGAIDELQSGILACAERGEIVIGAKALPLRADSKYVQFDPANGRLYYFDIVTERAVLRFGDAGQEYVSVRLFTPDEWKTVTQPASRRSKPTVQRSRGHPEDYGWKLPIAALRKKILDEGFPGEGGPRQSAYEAFLISQFSGDQVPSTSTIRGKVKEVISDIKEARSVIRNG